MVRYRNIAVPLNFASGIAAGGVGLCGPVWAADPNDHHQAIERKFEMASNEALKLLRGDASKRAPGLGVMSTANSAQWGCTDVYARGKGCAHASLDVNNAAVGLSLPPRSFAHHNAPALRR